MTADTSDLLASMPLNDDVVQAACISSAARLVAHGVYPHPNSPMAIDVAVVNIAARLYREFRDRVPHGRQ